MNKYRNFGLATILVISFACSSDFLELTPQQEVADTEAIQNLDDYKSAVTAIYNKISLANWYGRYFILVPDVMSDDVKQHPSANRARDYAEYDALDSDGIARELWEDVYEAVNAANAIINSSVDVPDAVKAEKDHLVGEAYALRGLAYFDMVRLWGQAYAINGGSSPGVPIVLEFDVSNEPSRNTVAEVYAQVLSDMNMALALMSNESRSGEATLLSAFAVKALLARVYLYMEDWQNARTMSDDVIANGGYSLITNANYAEQWALGTMGSEAIFEIAMTTNDNRGSDALGRMYIVEGYGDYLPSSDWSNLIPADDARRSWLLADPNLTGDFAPDRMVKYPSITGEDNTPVVRLAEMYLIRAEANARIGGNDAAVQADINTIRQRAYPAAAAVSAAGAALVDEVLLERRKELAFEGHRLWDLMRTGGDVVRTNCTSSVCTVANGADRVVLPIPLDEINANPNIQQNPGY